MEVCGSPARAHSTRVRADGANADRTEQRRKTSPRRSSPRGRWTGRSRARMAATARGPRIGRRRPSGRLNKLVPLPLSRCSPTRSAHLSRRRDPQRDEGRDGNRATASSSGDIDPYSICDAWVPLVTAPPHQRLPASRLRSLLPRRGGDVQLASWRLVSAGELAVGGPSGSRRGPR